MIYQICSGDLISNISFGTEDIFRCMGTPPCFTQILQKRLQFFPPVRKGGTTVTVMSDCIQNGN